MRKSIVICMIVICAILYCFVPSYAASDSTPQVEQGTEIQQTGEEQEIIIDDILPDSEDLFEEYVNQKLYPPVQSSRRKAKAKDRRSTLSETDQKVYDYLKERIKQVADGELSSTRFDIPVDVIFGEEVFQQYTAEELGVDDIVVDGKITQEAGAALYSTIYIDFSKVIKCLMSDSPYELYWYNKTKGVSYGRPSYSATSYRGNWRIYLPQGSSVTFLLSVAEEYALDGASYAADTSKTGAVIKAVETANEIVKSHASENDFKKLDSYRQEICNLVSYNHDAADNDDTPYGNPWQLIWVFDKIESTTVVCEGYAKAFQYLCDLSTFDSEWVECHTVTGTMSGGTGAGGHMWNIVTMDDGRNYLVDVTNCDAGSVGSPDKLFLAIPASGTVTGGYTFKPGSQEIVYIYKSDTIGLFGNDILTLSNQAYTYHSHEWDAGVITKDATCVDDGEKTYTCSFCGVTKRETIPATDQHTEEVISGKAATCTETGLTDGKKCSVCGFVIEQQTVIPALGHDYKEEVIVTKTANCSQTGERIYTCSVCGETKTEIIPVNLQNHVGETVVRNVKTATVEQKGYTGDSYCSSCGNLISKGKELARLIDPSTPDVQQKEKEITRQKNDNDPKGSAYSLLQLQAKAVKKNSIKLSWKKVNGASGYIVYGNLCGKGKYFKKLTTTTAASYTQKKLKKGTYYKYLVAAYKKVDGGQIILSTSKVVHVATTGGKAGNYKSVKLKKSKITLKKGKIFTLKATQVPVSKKLKVKKHRKIAYESSNNKVATVTAGGKIKAVGKGKCTIFVYAQNGISAKATVTVK